MDELNPQSNSSPKNWFSNHMNLAYVFLGLVLVGIVSAVFYFERGTVKIYQIQPNSGPIGTQISLTGKGFSEHNSIFFDHNDSNYGGYLYANSENSKTLNFTLEPGLHGCPTTVPSCNRYISSLVEGEYSLSVINYDGKRSNSVIFTVINEPVDTSVWKTYRNDEYGFEFEYPRSWNYTLENGGICLREDGKRYSIEQGEVCGIFISANPINPKRTSTEQLIKNRKADNPSLKVEKITIDNVPATRVKGYGDETYFDYQGNDFSISTTLDGDMVIIPILEKILSTFKFIN